MENSTSSYCCNETAYYSFTATTTWCHFNHLSVWVCVRLRGSAWVCVHLCASVCVLKGLFWWHQLHRLFYFIPSNIFTLSAFPYPSTQITINYLCLHHKLWVRSTPETEQMQWGQQPGQRLVGIHGYQMGPTTLHNMWQITCLSTFSLWIQFKLWICTP